MTTQGCVVKLAYRRHILYAGFWCKCSPVQSTPRDVATALILLGLTTIEGNTTFITCQYQFQCLHSTLNTVSIECRKYIISCYGCSSIWHIDHNIKHFKCQGVQLMSSILKPCLKWTSCTAPASHYRIVLWGPATNAFDSRNTGVQLINVTKQGAFRQKSSC